MTSYRLICNACGQEGIDFTLYCNHAFHSLCLGKRVAALKTHTVSCPFYCHLEHEDKWTVDFCLGLWHRYEFLVIHDRLLASDYAAQMLPAPMRRRLQEKLTQRYESRYYNPDWELGPHDWEFAPPISVRETVEKILIPFANSPEEMQLLQVFGRLS